jgi:hypothetical protein
MKKITFFLVLLSVYVHALSQQKNITGTYKLSYLKLDDGVALTPKNKDSIIKVKIDMALQEESLKNGDSSATYEDTLAVINDRRKFINRIMSLTLELKKDGSYNKKMNTIYINEVKIIESGKYVFNAKNNTIKFTPKQKTENAQDLYFKYDPIQKMIIVLTDEKYNGEELIKYKKVK